MSDPKNPGPKTEDTKRDGKVTDTQNVGGADRYLADVRGNVHGDNTSSTGGANNPGQHGRDGGEVDGVSNNPAPSEAAQKGETADAGADQSVVEDIKSDPKSTTTTSPAAPAPMKKL